jgi:hypothetical protein
MDIVRSRYWIIIGLGLILACTACNGLNQPELPLLSTDGAGVVFTSPTTGEGTQTQTQTVTPTSTSFRLEILTQTSTAWPTSTMRPSVSPTPTPSSSPTTTPSPTFTFPRITARMQANCRYGPGTAYLYAHGMYNGDMGTVWGRNHSGAWLWIQPDNIAYQCWIAASVVDVQGDIFSVAVASVRLPHTELYGPPESVTTVRSGDEVTVTWSEVPMTVDDFRGYLLEVTVCQNSGFIWMAVHTNRFAYTFTDQTNCGADSGGLLYAVDKHGYTDPVEIPWP